MSTDINCPLSCEAVSALLDEGVKAADNAAVKAHLAACGECRALSRILEWSASLSEEVPAGMTEAVMTQIRRERLKQKARMRFVRRFGAVAAAAVLVPAAVILAPILFGAGDAVPTEGVTAAVADTVPETMAQIAQTYADTTRAPVMMAAPPASAAAEATAAEDNAVNGTAETVPPSGPAPSYVIKSPSKRPDCSYATMAAEELKTSRPLQAVFTVLLGAEKAAALEEDDLAAAALLCYENEITREEFLAAADALHVEIAEEQIQAIFG